MNAPISTELVAGGRAFTVAPTRTEDHDELMTAFRQIVAANEGYPQEPDEPVTWADFEPYWLAPAAVSIVARAKAGGTFADGEAVFIYWRQL